MSGDGGSSDLEKTCSGGDEVCAAVADIHDTARANHMDFWSVTDHINGKHASDDTEQWRAVMDHILDGSDAEAEYLTILGAEVWFDFPHQTLGHKTLLLMGDDMDALYGTEMEDLQYDGVNHQLRTCDDIWDYAERLEERYDNVLLIPHHPALGGGMGTYWECHSGQRAQWYAPAVEIYSNHGNSEHGETDYDPMWIDPDHSRSVTTAISPDGFGLELGFIGGTDSHDTRPGSVCTQDTQHTSHPFGGGLTIAVIDEDEPYTRSNLFESIQARTAYATSGPLVPMKVTYSQDGVALGEMGEDLYLDPAKELEVEVRIPEEWVLFLDDVELVTADAPDGAGVGYIDRDNALFVGTLSPEALNGYVYPRLIIDGGAYYEDDGGCDDGGDNEEHIWASPSYLRPLLAGEAEGEEVEEDPCEGAVGPDAEGCEDGDVWYEHSRDFVAQEDPERPPPTALACNGLYGLGLGPGALLLGTAITLRRRRRQDRQRE